VDEIMKMTPEQLQKHELEIIGLYPNTYTFAKAMAERML
jgi:hypothetical protein